MVTIFGHDIKESIRELSKDFECRVANRDSSEHSVTITKTHTRGLFSRVKGSTDQKKIKKIKNHLSKTLSYLLFFSWLDPFLNMLSMSLPYTPSRDTFEPIMHQF